MADVLIAGSALAVLLGRAGLEVELFERGVFPKEKPCGEGLMPAGVGMLERHSLAEVVGGAPFWGVRYAAGFLDPITGGGMAQVLLSAELLAGYLAGRPAGDTWLWEFARAPRAAARLSHPDPHGPGAGSPPLAGARHAAADARRAVAVLAPDRRLGRHAAADRAGPLSDSSE